MHEGVSFFTMERSKESGGKCPAVEAFESLRNNLADQGKGFAPGNRRERRRDIKTMTAESLHTV